MKKPKFVQSAAERDRVLNHVDQKGAGYIFILDLEHSEGRRAAEKLKEYEDVAYALTVRASQNLLHCRFMLVLIPFAGRGHAVVAFTAPENLAESMELIHHRSRDFGDLFACVVCPANSELTAMFAELQDVAGSA